MGSYEQRGEKKQKISFRNLHRNSFVPGTQILINGNIQETNKNIIKEDTSQNSGKFNINTENHYKNLKLKEKNLQKNSIKEEKNNSQNITIKEEDYQIKKNSQNKSLKKTNSRNSLMFNLKTETNQQYRKIKKNNKNQFYKKSNTPSKQSKMSFKETSNAKKLKRKNSFYNLKKDEDSSNPFLYKKKYLKSENFIAGHEFGRNLKNEDDYDFNKQIDSFKNFKKMDFVYKNKKKEKIDQKNVYQNYDRNKEFFKMMEKSSKNENIEESEKIEKKRDNRLFTFENIEENSIEKNKTPKKKIISEKKNFLKRTKNSLSNKIIQTRPSKSKSESPKKKFLKNLLKKKSLKIPETPLISGITIILLNNHGDEKFIGLNGIEIFKKNGKKIDLSKKSQIYLKIKKSQKTLKSSNPLRLLSNHITKDVNKHWICDFSKNYFSRILIDFEKSVEIGMIRIWNYNCSRIRANRGVRNLVILEKNVNRVLFYGEVKMATGSLIDSRKNFENILFTKDESVLKKIAKNDSFFEYWKNKKIKKNFLKDNLDKRFKKRPITRDKNSSRDSDMKSDMKNNYFLQQNFKKKESSDDTKLYSFLPNEIKDKKNDFLKTKILKFIILQTWDNKNEFCLKGFDFFDKENNLINQNDYTYKTNARYNYITKNEKNLNLQLKKKKTCFFHNVKIRKNIYRNKIQKLHENIANKIFLSFQKKKNLSKKYKKNPNYNKWKKIISKRYLFY